MPSRVKIVAPRWCIRPMLPSGRCNGETGDEEGSERIVESRDSWRLFRWVGPHELQRADADRWSIVGQSHHWRYSTWVVAAFNVCIMCTTSSRVSRAKKNKSTTTSRRRNNGKWIAKIVWHCGANFGDWSVTLREQIRALLVTSRDDVSPWLS